MKKKSVILLIIVVAVLFGYGGFIIGTNNIKENKTAYQKGWTHWFSGYGLKGEGVQYIEHYEYGRHYDSKFENTYEAFVAGYKDGFYFVNHSEPDSYYDSKIIVAYKQYYAGNDAPKTERIAISNVYLSDDIFNSLSKTEKEEKYLDLINSKDVKKYVQEKYSNVGDVKLEFQGDGVSINVIYVCDSYSEDECIKIVEAYVSAFNEYMSNKYDVSVSVLNRAYVTDGIVEN